MSSFELRRFAGPCSYVFAGLIFLCSFLSISFYPSPLLTLSPSSTSFPLSFSSIPDLDYYPDRVSFSFHFHLFFLPPLFLFSDLSYSLSSVLFAGDGWKGRECFRIGHDVFPLTLTAISFCY
ncbi:hypothetical protein ASPFODRAFT_286415 [Aspergillus luchuensis CBS 106.47]|uniref:Transmembrane protein n=1 Tax=Aspergillus luchuensis (strain CBS 106.47) TaxID=1137211 RepID=A0A1M3TAI6_ASPLC|nr:hypothetical protein ASPFODRAFT_286415 [Aspergillus luchuensis CBS 106.47]